MKVQRVRLPGTDRVAWLVLDDSYIPVQPILSYLTFLQNLDRSPNTIRATAHRLKLFWEYLRDAHLGWKEMDVAQLAAFIPWLRRQDPAVISIAPRKAKRTNATIDLTLGAVYGFYSYHMRLETITELSLYKLAFSQAGAPASENAHQRASAAIVRCLYTHQRSLSSGAHVRNGNEDRSMFGFNPC
jgi:integrase/recombinase XerD